MRSSSRKRTISKERRLEEKIKELEVKLASSVPKAEYETLRLNLQLEIDDLQTKLSNSVPRADLEFVKNELQRVCDLEGRFGRIPTEETELRARISELEKLLGPTQPIPMAHNEGTAAQMESRVEELQQASSEGRKETDALESLTEDSADDESDSTDSDDADDGASDFEESRSGESCLSQSNS